MCASVSLGWDYLSSRVCCENFRYSGQEGCRGERGEIGAECGVPDQTGEPTTRTARLHPLLYHWNTAQENDQ